MRKHTPNEIIFIETGLIELKAEIMKRQFKFWSSTMHKVDNDTSMVTSVLIKRAIGKNIQYLRHYKNLVSRFNNPTQCFEKYKKDFTNRLNENIQKKLAKGTCLVLNDYFSLNATRSSPIFYREYLLNEKDRKLLTRYRTGSSFLKINTGYYSRTPIEERLCKCKCIQNLEHVLFHCPFTQAMRDEKFPSTLEELFNDGELAATKLRCMEKLLKLRTIDL